MKINCLIVDDEPLAVKVLETHIANIPSLVVCGSCGNAFAAMDILKQGKADLMFLDIHMPKLMGHEFLRTLRSPPKVIFTTAYREYALDAFELDAVDYLLKPITLERLVKAINKLSTTRIADEKEEAAIVDNEGFVYFRADRKMVKVKYDDIMYVESMKDYIKIIRLNDKPLLVKQSISSLEEVLPVNLFLRIHRSYIVAINKIAAFTNHDVEIGGMEIPIGRLYAHQVSKVAKE
ncbi:MAG: response regulator of the LytR/AlgR family [Flavisolibacter sp.]|jgi:DNA-binding LytR/AlgR family response regulator|nr:response regulator of the LytR/AlgR family [Flavisolibacter sp.]